MGSSNPTSNLERENAYLRQRNAQLQDDVTALNAEITRQRQMLERLPVRTDAAAIKPASA
jgi:cell division protein FtsB